MNPNLLAAAEAECVQSPLYYNGASLHPGRVYTLIAHGDGKVAEESKRYLATDLLDEHGNRAVVCDGKLSWATPNSIWK